MEQLAKQRQHGTHFANRTRQSDLTAAAGVRHGYRAEIVLDHAQGGDGCWMIDSFKSGRTPGLLRRSNEGLSESKMLLQVVGS
jgi:hypothetical protein